MYHFSTYREQYKQNLRLALPVVLTQLGQILTQLADNLMVGQYGGNDPLPLAATSFGGTVFFILFIASIGLALGMTPLIGELYAQGDREKSAGLLQNGILFYGLLGVVMSAVQYAVIPLMYHLNQPAEVVDAAIPYYKMLVYSMPAVMLFFAFKQFLEGVGNTRAEMYATIIANGANIVFNWIFIYGRWGIPEMGAEGAGLGTLLARVIGMIVIIGYFLSRSRYRLYLKSFSPAKFSRADVRQLLHMGGPISLQMFLEASAFVGTSIMMGWFGTGVTTSATQLAMTLGTCAPAGRQSLVSPPAGLERLGRAGLHLPAALHPHALHLQRRGHRHRLAAAGLRRPLPALGRHSERLGRYPARHSGRTDHHAHRPGLLLAAEPPRRVSPRILARDGTLGTLRRLLVRALVRRPADDSAHPAKRPPTSRKEIKKFSYLYANYTRNGDRKTT